MGHEASFSLKMLFHDFNGAIGGISIIAYTFAYKLEVMKPDLIDENIVNETLEKLCHMDKYYNRVRDSFGGLCGIFATMGIDDHSRPFILELEERLKDVSEMIAKVRRAHEYDTKNDVKKYFSDMIHNLYQIQPKCIETAAIVTKFKEQLVSMGKYM